MSTALVLSGGGAKGSFELGVLQYLYKYHFVPEIITSTSVGSINGLKLAEGRGPGSQGFAGLEQIWLNLNKNEDMYDEEGWVKGLAEWIKDIIRSQPVNLFHSEVGTIFHNMLGNLVLLIPGVAADLLDDLKKFQEGLEKNKSLFHIEPIRILGEAHVSPDLVQASGIKLRMAVVALESGRLLYVTEHGRLVDNAAKWSDDPASPKVGLVPGMLASAAIPAIFRPQWLAGEWCVDGGTREIVPISAAVALGATDVYVVVAPVTLQQDPSFGPAPIVIDILAGPTKEQEEALKQPVRGIADIAGRAIDILADEVIESDLRCNESSNVRIHVIRPNIEVEPSRTIDRGLIRINASYGYMKAFDVLGQFSHALRHQLTWLSDAIIELRLRIWNLENELSSTVFQWMHEPLFRSSAMAEDDVRAKLSQIRDLKKHLRGYMDCRFACGGAEALSPEGYPNAWFQDWEEHELGWHILGASPWAEVAWPLALPRAEAFGFGAGSNTGTGAFGAGLAPPPAPVSPLPTPISNPTLPPTLGTGGFGSHPGGAFGSGAGVHGIPDGGPSPLSPARPFSGILWQFYMFVPAAEPEAIPFSACRLGYKSSPPAGPFIEFGDASKHLAIIRHGIPERYTQDTASSQWRISEAFWAPPASIGNRNSAQLIKVPTSISLMASVAEVKLVALVQFAARPNGPELSLYNYNGKEWEKLEDVAVLGPSGSFEALTGLTCAPAILEGTWGSKSNYEMICGRSGSLKHYARINDEGKRWIYVQDVPLTNPQSSANVMPIVSRPIAVSLIQSSFAKKLFPIGDLELFVVLEHTRSGTERNYLAELSFDARTRKWTRPRPVVASNRNMITEARRVRNVVGRPAVVQDIGSENFEMLVIRDGGVHHYTKLNSNAGRPWTFRSTVFQREQNYLGFPDSVALYQCLGTRELEAVIRIHKLGSSEGASEDELRSYRYSYHDHHWHGPSYVRTLQNMPTNVQPF